MDWSCWNAFKKNYDYVRVLLSSFLLQHMISPMKYLRIWKGLFAVVLSDVGIPCFLYTEWFGMKSFASKAFSDYSFCSLLQFRGPLLFPNWSIVWWLSLLHNFIHRSLNSGFAQVQVCLRRVGDLRWWGSLTMVLAGNKAKRLSSFNHTTRTIHNLCHHHQPLSIRLFMHCFLMILIGDFLS